MTVSTITFIPHQNSLQYRPKRPVRGQNSGNRLWPCNNIPYTEHSLTRINMTATEKIMSIASTISLLRYHLSVFVVALIVGLGWAQPSAAASECRNDIVFLMDVTGSMGSAIADTKRSATEILADLAGRDPRFHGVDAAFGVAAYWGDPHERDNYFDGFGRTFSTWWFCGNTSSYPDREKGAEWLFDRYPDRYNKWRCDYGTDTDLSDDHKSLCRIYYPSYPEVCDLQGEGWVYVADQANHRIQKFNSSGDWVKSWGQQGTEPGKFVRPKGVTVAGASIYVADSGNHRIQIFKHNGDLQSPRLTTTSATGVFKHNEQITGSVSGARGRVISHSDSELTYESLSGSFTTSDVLSGEWGETASVDTIAQSATWGVKGTDAGQLTKPTWIAVDSSKNVYVSEPSQDRVQKFDANGSYLLKLDGTFDSPQGIAIDSDDDVYVVDQKNHRIQKFDSSGSLVTDWATGGRLGSFGAGDGRFRSPRGIVIDSDDQLYVTDTGNHRVQKFDKTGAFLTKWGQRGQATRSGVFFQKPTGIGLNKAGDIYVVDKLNHRVQQFTPDGMPRDTPNQHAFGAQGDGNREFKKPHGVDAVGAGGLSNDERLERAQDAFKVYTQLTTREDQAEAGINKFDAKLIWKTINGRRFHTAGDWPEAGHFALHQLATEGGNTDGHGETDQGYFSCGRAGYVVDPDWKGEASAAPRVTPWELPVDKRKRACKEGSIGWRDKSKRTIVLVGDAPSHHTTVDVDEAIQALGEQGIAVVHLNTKKKFWGLDSCMNDAGELDWYEQGKCGKPGYAAESDASLISEETGGVIQNNVAGGEDVLNAILKGVARSVPKAGSQAAVTFSGQTIKKDLYLFETKFNGDGWHGDLVAKEFDPNVDVKELTVAWSAAEEMTRNPGRLGMTSDSDGAYELNWSNCKERPQCYDDFRTDPTGVTGDEAMGGERLRWLLLGRTQEGKKLRARKSTLRGGGFDNLMGDIWHSSPVYVGQAAGPWRDGHSFVKKNNLYSKFVDKTKSRTPHIYVGSIGGCFACL